MQTRLDDREVVVEVVRAAQLADVRQQRVHDFLAAAAQVREVSDAAGQVPQVALFTTNLVDAIAEDEEVRIACDRRGVCRKPGGAMHAEEAAGGGEEQR